MRKLIGLIALGAIVMQLGGCQRLKEVWAPPRVERTQPGAEQHVALTGSEAERR